MTAHYSRLQQALVERYTIQRELGRGGMATVYLAQDLKHRRLVAIKVLQPELASALGPERFLREIEVASQLTHPHILPLYDSGATEGYLYYVMPYIEGESLRDRLQLEKQLPLEQAVAIARNVAAALTYSHSHGVIHRDIKPENILLASGEAIVADFGIAKAVSAAGGERLTQTGLTMGTAAYMSPEQSFGERDLDARTDIYSLGCVLYEMLVGQPPYTGSTVQAIIARRMNDPVPSVRASRETVPVSIEVAIQKALARTPADRFSTADQFAAALTADIADSTVPVPAGQRQERWISRGNGFPRRRAAQVAGFLLIALLGLAVWFRRSSPATSLDADLIAVAPFDVRGAELASWGEGIVDYLSRSLDGAGPLRTVSPSTFLRRWSGRADPASAQALGRRTGSGLVVFGSVIKAAGDSLRLRATLLDVGSGNTTAEVEVSGDTLSIDRLADSLAVALLAGLGRTRPVGAVRNAPLGGVSLPAIKEFLRGEQMYRQSQWDSALSHYAGAVALDSTFALAYRRIAAVLGWGPRTIQSFEPMTAYIAKAAAFNHGLHPRDSLLILAEFIGYQVDRSSDSFFSDLSHLTATLEEAARRFPGDPEVWQALGEARYHQGFSQGVTPPGEVLAAFDRAIDLDSGFTPAFEHVFQLGFLVGGVDRARVYARAYTALGPNDANSSSLLFAAALLDSVRANSPENSQLIRAADTRALFRGGFEILLPWADSAETAVALLRELAGGGHEVVGEPHVNDSLMWPKYLARVLLFRGHVREALAVYRPLLTNPDALTAWGGFSDPLVDLGFLGAIPPDTVSVILDRARHASQGFQVRAMAWWLFRRDTLSLQRFVRDTDAETRSPRSGIDRAVARYFEQAANGYVMLIRGDTVSALRTFEAMPDSMCLAVPCFLHKLTEARVLATQGEDRKAADILDRYRSVFNPLHTIATLERGRIAERLGERDVAVDSYHRVVDFWRRADPELQPYVSEARAGLARLTRER
jgi:hypothetical protein